MHDIWNKRFIYKNYVEENSQPQKLQRTVLCLYGNKCRISECLLNHLKAEDSTQINAMENWSCSGCLALKAQCCFHVSNKAKSLPFRKIN